MTVIKMSANDPSGTKLWKLWNLYFKAGAKVCANLKVIHAMGCNDAEWHKAQRRKAKRRLSAAIARRDVLEKELVDSS